MSYEFWDRQELITFTGNDSFAGNLAIHRLLQRLMNELNRQKGWLQGLGCWLFILVLCKVPTTTMWELEGGRNWTFTSFLLLISLPPVQVLLSAPNDAPFGQVHIWSPPGTGTQRWLQPPFIMLQEVPFIGPKIELGHELIRYLRRFWWFYTFNLKGRRREVHRHAAMNGSSATRKRGPVVLHSTNVVL